MTDLRQIMLEESRRRNYASGTHLDRFAHRFRIVVLGIEGATAASDECYRLVACLSSGTNVFSEFAVNNIKDGLVEFLCGTQGIVRLRRQCGARMPRRLSRYNTIITNLW